MDAKIKLSTVLQNKIINDKIPLENLPKKKFLWIPDQCNNYLRFITINQIFKHLRSEKDKIKIEHSFKTIYSAKPNSKLFYFLHTNHS